MVKVMLIEREYLFQKAFAKMIDRVDNCCLVGIADSGMEAMEMVQQFHPQIVFSEVFLGNENGIDICKGIKHEYPDISTVILSNYRNMNLVNKAMQTGVEQYLLKPVSQKKIADLCEYNTPQKEDNEHTRELFQSFEEKDYKKTYNVAKKYIQYIFDEMDLNERKDEILSTAAAMLYMIPGLDRSQQEYYMKKYELNAKVLSKKVLCHCWLMQIVTEVYRQVCVMKYAHMNQVLQYIEANKNNEISLTALSDQAGVSSGYLSRIFKKYYHISVVDYIHLRKILVAKQYMVSSEMNISDISFLLGYSEAGYFCKIFKKYEEMTPSAFHNAYA